MLKQYQQIKQQHKDCLLFFRLGDFYEMFYEDAQKASRILDLVLTSRGSDGTGKVPMCGIPFHAADSYIARLIKQGLKVAICEQLEDPALTKGLVKRDVTRVVTAGTFIDEKAPLSRYIVCLIKDKTSFGVAFTDVSSGTIYTNQLTHQQKVIDLISRLSVYEVVIPIGIQDQLQEIVRHSNIKLRNAVISPYEDWPLNPDIARKTLLEHFKTHNLRGFGIDDMPLAISSAGALLEYIKQMNQQPMRHIDKLSLYSENEYVWISPAAMAGLELETFVQTLEQTLTPLGKRMLRQWVYNPLKNIQHINLRQEAVTLLKDNTQVAQGLFQILHSMPDIERSLCRLSSGYSGAKNLLAIRNALTRVPDLKKAVAPLYKENALFKISDIPTLRNLLTESMNPEMPLSHPEGKIIRQGYNRELDELRDIQENGRQWLKRFQEQEIIRTKINSLKVGFNNVFGYYIEISKPNLPSVPSDYIRKQTLVNAERFITPQLKEFEEKTLTAEQDLLKLESSLLGQIEKATLDHAKELNQLSQEIATIDLLYCLSRIALQAGYIRPVVTEDTKIIIKDGRHPVVEKYISSPFVPNDTLLDCNENHLLIITGPNMAGKSTYIRQTALLVIMAQIGSYIPAASAEIGIVDKVFTRIGAQDDITKGQSTFMVEMSETADILNNLSPRSLIVLDEIGRGTSTYDGLSLAWAVAEYLQQQKVRVLFATHFHELTALAEEHSGVKNYNIAVKEWKDEIIFLHTIVPGGCDDSYGIYVAQLAGIPQQVIQRGKEILTQLEIESNLQQKISYRRRKEIQLSIFSDDKDPVLEKIRSEIDSLNTDGLTPLDALNKIHQWKELIDKDGKGTHPTA